MRSLTTLVLACTATLLFQATAQAGTIGYLLQIRPGTSFGAGVPEFALTNLSISGAEITNFEFSIGDTSKNFDGYQSVSTPGLPGITYTFNGIDTNLFGGLSSDVFSIDFTGFITNPLGRFVFEVDLDDDGSAFGGPASFATVFWNNGALPNSTVKVTFSDGNVLTQTLPENPVVGSGDRYTFIQELDLSGGVIPEPTSLAVFFGIFAVGFSRSRPRRR